jgi:hypothetical protein
MPMSEPDLRNRARHWLTDHEHDALYEAVEELPRRYFGDGWTLQEQLETATTIRDLLAEALIRRVKDDTVVWLRTDLEGRIGDEPEWPVRIDDPFPGVSKMTLYRTHADLTLKDPVRWLKVSVNVGDEPEDPYGAKAAAEAAELLRILRLLQWGDRVHLGFCPFCGRRRAQVRHDTGCLLAKAIDAPRDDPKEKR